MRNIGMRPIAKGDDFAVLELRGGTHLVLLSRDEVEPTEAPFDLMVDDLEATRERFVEIGLSPTEIASGRIHRCFYVQEPSGHRIKVNSTHVSERAV